MPAKSPSDILDQDTPKAPQKNRRGQMADPLQTPTQRGYRSVTVHQDHTAASGTNPTQQSQEVEEQGLTFNAALIKPVASSAISAAKNPRLRGAAPTVKTTHKGPKATIPAKTEQVHVTPYESAQPTPEMKDLLGNPLRLITFLSTQVMECPPAYKRQAMSGTRGTTNADYSLKDTSNQLEMLVYDPNFMEDAAHQLRPKLEQVVLHPSDPWVIAKIGQYHPAFTQQDRCDVVHSEMDIADLVRNVLLRPSLFALRAVKAFQTLSEEPTPKQLCEAIMKDEKLSEFVITSSEPQVIKVPANGEDSVTIDRETATPDLIGSRLEFTDVFNNRVHKRTSILIAELKSVNALRIEDGGRNEKKPTLRNVTTLNQDESYHFTAFRWPGNKGQITRKRDRIICQVITQMTAANVKYAILSCYAQTAFFIRDSQEPSVIYISRFYDTKMPILLYCTTFLAMAGDSTHDSNHLLLDHTPKVPRSLIHEELAKARKHIEEVSTAHLDQYGVL